MADQKVSALTELTAFTGDEGFYVVEDDDGTPVSRRATVETVAKGLIAYSNTVPEFITRATGSNLSLNATAITELAAATNGPGTGGFDIVLDAATGDVVEFAICAMANNDSAQAIGLDVYTMVGGSRVNPFGVGLSASLASTFGVMGWYTEGATRLIPITGSVMRTLVSGDISSGTVTLRLHYAKANTTARTIFSTANFPFHIWAKNHGH